jgi:hypothetical protein
MINCNRYVLKYDKNIIKNTKLYQIHEDIINDSRIGPQEIHLNYNFFLWLEIRHERPVQVQQNAMRLTLFIAHGPPSRQGRAGSSG